MNKLFLNVFLLLPFSISVTMYGLPRSGATVKDSYISNVTSGTYAASGKSSINAGVNAADSNISDSVITNTSSGRISASNRSDVNIGVNAAGVRVDNSNLSANSNVSINANRSRVDTGINVSGARNSNISTNVNAGINAKNSVVNVGSVDGYASGKSVSTNVSAGVNAKNKTVNIGNVSLGGGRSAAYKTIDYKSGSSMNRNSQNIGNVIVESNKVKEVNTFVGGEGTMGKKMMTKHMAKYYSDKGGVDPSGTQHVYVSRSDRRKAEKNRKGGAAGNTVIKRGSKVTRVNTYVE